MIQDALFRVLNHLLAQGGWARRHLRSFAGRQAQFVIPPWQFTLGIDTDGGFQRPGDAAPADVTISLPGSSPWLFLGGVDRLMANAHVTGNAEFATALSFVLRNLRWDAEEDLARLFGDMVAHRMVGAAGSAATWQRRAAENLVENLAGYFGEESRLLVPAGELANFQAELAELDGRLDRLAGRVAGLSP